ncbi:MAG: hypothetical protein HKN36_05310 [Hellea sp.]|nr:hypothetical protein [Hellea sp.]
MQQQYASPSPFFDSENQKHPLPKDLKKTDLPTRWFNRENNLPSTQVHALEISMDGRIWAATPTGLVCYNGVTFETFGPKDGLSSHGIRSLAIDHKNNLWVGTDFGLDILELNSHEPILRKSRFKGTIDSITIMSDNLAILGTPTGVFSVKKTGKFKSLNVCTKPHAQITRTFRDEEHALWIAGPDTGAAYFQQGKWHSIPANIQNAIGAPSCFAQGPEDGILIGGNSGIVLYFKDDRQAIVIQSFAPVSSLLYADNLIWSGEGDSLRRISIHGSTMTYIDQLIPKTNIRDLRVDEFRNVWVATDEDGIARISGLRHIYKSQEQIDIGGILSISPSARGSILCGSRGVLFQKNQKALRGIKVWDAVMDANGRIWAATENGLHSFTNSMDEQPYLTHESALAGPGRCVVNFKGYLYVGTLRGLGRIDGAGTQEVLDNSGASLGYVYSLHIGPHNDLWIATLGNGLWRLKGDIVEKISAGHLTPTSNVYALAHSKSFEMYIAHDDMIEQIEPIHSHQNFLIKTPEPVAAWSLHCPGNGRLYAGTSNGLVVYDTNAGSMLHRLADGSGKDQWEFTTSRSIQAHGKYIACGLSSGLKFIDIDKLESVKSPPAPLLSKIKWQNTQVKLKKNFFTVKTGKWRVEIDLQFRWYLDESDCQMQYQLVGFDDNWSSFEALNTITYTSLPEGRYRLLCRVLSPIGGLSEIAQLAEFDVAA